jgi:alcohol dehydrogenase class IV
MRFEFATATRILFGAGTLAEVAPLAREMGRRALVVTGSRVERAARLLEGLASARVEALTFSVPHEPTTDLVRSAVGQARQAGCDLVIGCGGGSVLDASKAIAALLTNDGDLIDYLEVIGQARPLQRPAAPCIAIPTTAGTGAEVTRNSVLVSPAHKVKVSLRSPFLLPRAAVVDPELTCELPPTVTASTGLDALTQLIEPFVSHRANPMTDALCREGLKRVARSLRRACASPDQAAREDMALGSLFGGLALANAGLGAVHGFAAPLGGQFPAPHGAICAALLPHVMQMNVRALRARDPNGATLGRYREISRSLTGEASADESAGVVWVRELCEALRIPKLRDYGLPQDHLSELVEQALQASSMKGNPIPLTREELGEILRQAW